MNDLATHVTSSISTFACDCVIYHYITNENDQLSLQEDLNVISYWGTISVIELNTNRCKSVSVSAKRSPIQYTQLIFPYKGYQVINI